MKITALVILSILATAANAEQYLCVADAATGFYFEDGKWISTKFRTNSSKYIIRRFKEGEYFSTEAKPYGVFPLGKKAAKYSCYGPNPPEVRNFNCDGGFGEFLFSPKSGRYLRTYTVGYYEGVDTNKNSPQIEIGKCSEI